METFVHVMAFSSTESVDILVQATMSSTRKELVQELRALAQQCGVQRVRDDAAKEKVLQMVANMRQKTLA